MSDNSHHVTDEQIQELARQFPALHQPSDCLAAVRRIGGMFATIIHGRDHLERSGFFIAPGAKGPDDSSPVALATAPAKPGRRPGMSQEYTLDHANEIARELAALPPLEDSRRGLNKQQVVRRLAGEIATLQARGYTIDEIVERLVALGFEITAPTLKSYLQRAKASRRRRKQGRRSSRRGAGDGAAEIGPSTEIPLVASPSAENHTEAGRLPSPESDLVWSQAFRLPDEEDLSIDIDVDLDEVPKT